MSTAPSEQRSSIRSSGLQFKRTTNSAPELHIDWDEVHRTLETVDPSFSDPRFDPLKHALKLLGSITAEREINELREQWIAVDELVDTVVEIHYAGFNQSLQKYSQIIRTFTESREQLATLRRSLELAQARLKPQPESLRDLYRNYLMLGDMVRLLQDVQSAVAVPAHVRELQDSGDWALAVNTLLEGCNKVAREELIGISALKQLRDELSRRRNALVTAITIELEKRTYIDGVGSSAALWTAGPHTPLRTRMRIPTGPNTAPRPTRTLSFTSTEGIVGADQCNRSAAFEVQRPLHRRAATYAAGTPPGIHASLVDDADAFTGHLLESEVSLNTLVSCCAQLGGVPVVLESLRSRMPTKIRSRVMDALDSFSRAHWTSGGHITESAVSSPTRINAVRSLSSMGGSSNDSPVALSETAEAVVRWVFERCFSSLQSVARLLQMLSLANPPAASAGLRMVMGEGTASSESTKTDVFQDGQQGSVAALKECQFAWEILQVECQTMLAAILGAPPPARQSRRKATAEMPGSGWLASIAILEEDDAAEEGEHAAAVDEDDVLVEGRKTQDTSSISFSLLEESSVLLVPTDGTAVPSVTASSVAQEGGSGGGDGGGGGGGGGGGSGGGYETLVALIFAGRGGSPELAAAVYQPTMKFVDAAERLLLSLSERGSQKPQSASAQGTLSRPEFLQAPWVGSIPSSSSADGGQSLGAHKDTLLKSYLDSFLRMEFLPTVYISSRSRIRVLLEGSSEALVPRMRLRGSYKPGAAVLPAASGTVELSETLLDWIMKVPPYAPHLAGVLENALGQILESFQSKLEATLGTSAAGVLSQDVDTVQVMASEPGAAALGPPVAFYVAQESDAINAFVSSAIAAGFGSREPSKPKDLVAKVLAARPLRSESLLSIGNPSRMIALACLAESADHIADAIHSYAAAAAFTAAASSGSGGGKPVAASPPGAAATASPRMADIWRRHLGGFWRGGSGEGGRREVDRSFAEGLSRAADRFRAVAGQCIRAVRLDLLLLAAYHLQSLPQLAYGSGSGSRAAEAEDHVASLARGVAQLDETLRPYLPPDRRAYVFASVPIAIMQMTISALPEFSTIDAQCVTRVCRLLSALQPVLAACAAGPLIDEDPQAAETTRADASRQLEKAKLYYSMLTYSADSLLSSIAHKPRRFGGEEYKALFMAHVPGREVGAEHFSRLSQILESPASGR